MYRRYTQIFRIFGAMIIFLQIPKVSALFKIQKISKPYCSSLSFSLTTQPHSSVTHNRTRRRCHHWPAQNAPAASLRRGGQHLNDLHHPTNPSQSLERQQAHRRELHAGHGSSGTTVHGITPAMMQ